MNDIVTRMGRWAIESGSVPASDLMDEAAKEIEWLRQNRNHWMRTAHAFDEHLATMRVALMEQPGVRFGGECPYVTGRTTKYCTLTPFTLTDAEREAVDRARIAFRDMDHNAMTMQQLEDYEALCGLLSRTGSNSRQTRDNASESGDQA